MPSRPNREQDEVLRSRKYVVILVIKGIKHTSLFFQLRMTTAAKPPVIHTNPPSWVWRTIPPAGLKVGVVVQFTNEQALDKYKYTGEDLSILVRLFLRDFWNACMVFIPETVAYVSTLHLSELPGPT